MKNKLKNRYLKIRKKSEELCAPLEIEDYVIQSHPDVSPPKWHLGHTTWFFESFVLKPFFTDYKFFNEKYNHLFNSYYKSMGTHWLQPERGLLSRPLVSEIYQFRNNIDEMILTLLESCNEETFSKISRIIEVGLQHEQQHQELLLMDIKHNFSLGPLNIAYIQEKQINKKSLISKNITHDWIEFDGGIIETGNDGKGFFYDHEGPKHKNYLNPFKISNTLVTNGQFQKFIEDEGYNRPEFWLSDGFNFIQKDGITTPLYWSLDPDSKAWYQFTLEGHKKLNRENPVTHISYYEASAFCEWAGNRLPTEFEWERSVSNLLLNEIEGNFLEQGQFGATSAGTFNSQGPLYDMLGNVWEWTSSSYLPYPGYNRQKGPLGEYNGKFMNNQRVLKGGSFATPKDHIRTTYRNFYYPEKRWAFNGFRMARDI